MIRATLWFFGLVVTPKWSSDLLSPNVRYLQTSLDGRITCIFWGSQPAFHFLNRCSSRKCGESTFITTHPNPCPPGAAARTAETLCVVTVKLCNKTETFPDSIPMKSWVFIEIPGMEKKNKANFKKSPATLGHSGRSQYSKLTQPEPQIELPDEAKPWDLQSST